jgi:hypothetical protein
MYVCMYVCVCVVCMYVYVTGNSSFSNGQGQGGGGGGVTGHLSELFSSISVVCEEQFALIRRIFPNNVVAR